ncbi:AsmA family protein [Solimicrobium silvestre]|uniref:Uncharacterized protein involved in outer membrane biogenesis n=1 Tax=Solimicrobium silvestre TaxID=2099400 RepID=A0A2S9GZX3_9BURK|nr:AsmA family protein [Solimicrobium silvestre]PRC93284.1 Uncharacterized protein involved in outer membrane biogenesis [Solimicrobium silvestre]
MPAKFLKILFYITAPLLLIVVISMTLLFTYDWNQARPFINRTVSSSIGRDFAVRGDLKIQLISGSQTESGWERYLTTLPILRISADDVQISNPSWSHVGAQMASARRVVVLLKPFALLSKEAIVTELDLDTPLVVLERRADGSNSWSLPDNGPSTWAVQIQRLAFADGNMRYVDYGINLDLHARATSVAGDALAAPDQTKNALTAQQFGLQFILGGTYHHAAISGSGKLGSVLTLENKSTVFPIQADMQIGANKIAFNGVITDPRAPSGINVELTLGGTSLAALYPLTGVLLPETAAYKTRGRLLGQKEHANWNWTYQNFIGTVGASDLAGTLQYVYRLPRPLLRGAVTSNQLRLDDLGPIIGADSNEHKIARGEAPIQPDGKALPVEQFHTAQWGALDADVKFSGKHLIRTHDIPLDNIVTDIHLENKVLSLAPLYFGLAGGDVTSNIVLDGRKPAIDAQIKMAARNLQLRELFPTLQSMKASFGEINGDAALTGHGNSVSAMLASSNGELVATMSQGSVSRYILEAAGLNVANVLFVKMFGDKQVRLNCLVSDFAVNAGVAGVRHFVIDTDDAIVNITGEVDLSRELLNLDVRPNTKGMRIFSLRSPLYAKGSFEHPDVGPYKGPLVLRATAAIALAALSPPAAALASVNLGTTPIIDCPAELNKALRTRSAPKSEPTASPAGRVSNKEIQKSREEK